MAITDENMVLPVQPLYNGGNYGNNGGFFGGGDSLLGILFLIALLNGGYSYADAKQDMIAELKELAAKAPDDKTKQEIEHFANEMESK